MCVDSHVTMNQLHCTGIIECVKVRGMGWPHRREYRDFIGRYGCIAYSDAPTDKEMTKELIGHVGISSDDAEYGNSKVFLTEAANRRMEGERDRCVEMMTVKIQKVYRGHVGRKVSRDVRRAVEVIRGAVLVRRVVKELNDKRNAAIIIQSGARKEDYLVVIICIMGVYCMYIVCILCV